MAGFVTVECDGDDCPVIWCSDDFADGDGLADSASVQDAFRYLAEYEDWERRDGKAYHSAACAPVPGGSR